MPTLMPHLVTIMRRCSRYLDALFKSNPLYNDNIVSGFRHTITKKLCRTLQYLALCKADLRHQNEHFAALLRTSPIAIVTLDLNFRIVSWNPAAEQLFGYSQQEVLHQSIADMIARDERQRSECTEHWHQISTGTPLVQAVTQRTCKDGTTIDVEMQAVPVIVDAKWVGVIVTYYDVSELLQARHQAEDASKAKSMFLANMSHELRTPLNAILGFAQIIYASSNVSIEHRHYINIIHRSGEHLLTLINNILDLSKIEAGHMPLDLTCFDLYLLLNDVEDMFALRTVEQGLLLILERHPDVPRYIRADSGKLRQVLINLLSNAVKFTDEGSIMLRVTQSSSAADLCFEIADTGAGIAAEELDIIFEPFTQTQTGRQSQKGTGLGLTISRRFVELMGGTIQVHSQVAHGTTFSFNLPVTVVAANDLSSSSEYGHVIGLLPDQPAYRILVVDDNVEDRLLLIKLLEPLGMEIREATNGVEACAIWAAWNPQLIWMDMRMPVMDGYEATRRIKATLEGKSTLIIALTASSFEEERALVLSTGCDDLLHKPFHDTDILTLMQKHMDIRYIYAQNETPDPAIARSNDSMGQNHQSNSHMPSVQSMLATIPVDLLEQLYQATMHSNMIAINSLIDHIHTYSAPLANALKQLADDFAYDRILSLIEKTRGTHG